jgi:hypothetical protein
VTIVVDCVDVVVSAGDVNTSDVNKEVDVCSAVNEIKAGVIGAAEVTTVDVSADVELVIAAVVIDDNVGLDSSSVDAVVCTVYKVELTDVDGITLVVVIVVDAAVDDDSSVVGFCEDELGTLFELTVGELEDVVIVVWLSVSRVSLDVAVSVLLAVCFGCSDVEVESTVAGVELTAVVASSIDVCDCSVPAEV